MTKQNRAGVVSNMAPTATQSSVLKFIEWLTYKPSAAEVARGLVLEYFADLGATKSRLALLHEDDSLHYIGDYGWEGSLAGTKQDSAEWRSRTDEIAKIKINANHYGWNPEKTLCGAPMRECGTSQGSVVIIFDRPVADPEEVGMAIASFALTLGFYFCSTMAKPSAGSGQVRARLNENPGKTKELFSQRQLSILQGMVEGKTNHELATDLGFSVSTIRHETMRIYQILEVSDRREAAREALDRKIL